VSILVFFFLQVHLFCLSEPLLSPSFHPNCSIEQLLLVASWAFQFQQVLLPDNRPGLTFLRREPGQALLAVT
jgi:hypothetical protein